MTKPRAFLLTVTGIVAISIGFGLMLLTKNRWWILFAFLVTSRLLAAIVRWGQDQIHGTALEPDSIDMPVKAEIVITPGHYRQIPCQRIQGKR